MGLIESGPIKPGTKKSGWEKARVDIGVNSKGYPVAEIGAECEYRKDFEDGPQCIYFGKGELEASIRELEKNKVLHQIDIEEWLRRLDNEFPDGVFSPHPYNRRFCISRLNVEPGSPCYFALITSQLMTVLPAKDHQ